MHKITSKEFKINQREWEKEINCLHSLTTTILVNLFELTIYVSIFWKCNNLRLLNALAIKPKCLLKDNGGKCSFEV